MVKRISSASEKNVINFLSDFQLFKVFLNVLKSSGIQQEFFQTLEVRDCYNLLCCGEKYALLQNFLFNSRDSPSGRKIILEYVRGCKSGCEIEERICSGKKDIGDILGEQVRLITGREISEQEVASVSCIWSPLKERPLYTFERADFCMKEFRGLVEENIVDPRAHLARIVRAYSS